MQLQPLVRLCALRWNLPVVSALAPAPRTFGELVEGLGASRDALSRSLTAVRAAGWVGPAQERGYALTVAGRRLSPACDEVLRIARALSAQELLLRKWSLPTTAALQGWSLRFNELLAVLPGITNRALTLTLKDLARRSVVERMVEPGYPPSVSYRLSADARALAPAAERLARAA